MHVFDPVEFIRGLQQILVSDKKRVGFLFGAGTSVAKKSSSSPNVSAVFQMTKEIVEKLTSIEKRYETCFNQVKDEIGPEKFNIESILSKLEQKYEVVGRGELNGLDSDGLSKLI